ncbi:hypothetical protein SNEBB_010396 [Seison nebaliae]|nr:hypothetical protein SNEBB_010396 [Seison nebaliae]
MLNSIKYRTYLQQKFSRLLFSNYSTKIHYDFEKELNEIILPEKEEKKKRKFNLFSSSSDNGNHITDDLFKKPDGNSQGLSRLFKYIFNDEISTIISSYKTLAKHAQKEQKKLLDESETMKMNMNDRLMMMIDVHNYHPLIDVVHRLSMEALELINNGNKNSINNRTNESYVSSITKRVFDDYIKEDRQIDQETENNEIKTNKLNFLQLLTLKVALTAATSESFNINGNLMKWMEINKNKFEGFSPKSVLKSISDNVKKLKNYQEKSFYLFQHFPTISKLSNNFHSTEMKQRNIRTLITLQLHHLLSNKSENDNRMKMIIDVVEMIRLSHQIHLSIDITNDCQLDMLSHKSTILLAQNDLFHYFIQKHLCHSQSLDDPIIPSNILSIGNKLALLCGDYLLARASTTLASTRSPQSVVFVSDALKKISEMNYTLFCDEELLKSNESFNEFNMKLIVPHLTSNKSHMSSLLIRSCQQYLYSKDCIDSQLFVAMLKSSCALSLESNDDLLNSVKEFGENLNLFLTFYQLIGKCKNFSNIIRLEIGDQLHLKQYLTDTNERIHQLTQSSYKQFHQVLNDDMNKKIDDGLTKSFEVLTSNPLNSLNEYSILRNWNELSSFSLLTLKRNYLKRHKLTLKNGKQM